MGHPWYETAGLVCKAWFIAEEPGARAVASRPSRLQRCRALLLRNVRDADLDALWQVLCDALQMRPAPVLGDSLFVGAPDEWPCVQPVNPDLIQALARVPQGDRADYAARWAQADLTSGPSLLCARNALRGLCRFARLASRKRKPVWQLSEVE